MDFAVNQRRSMPRPLIFDGVSIFNSYKKDFLGNEQELPNGDVLFLFLADFFERGHKIVVYINKRDVSAWSNPDAVKALNKIAIIVPLSVDHSVYKHHLVNTALRNGGLVISNDVFTDVYDTLANFPNIVVEFSIGYKPIKPEYFPHVFQTGIMVVFHLNGRNWNLYSDSTGDSHNYSLAQKCRLSTSKRAIFWDIASKWLIYYNFKIFEYYNVQRQNYMGLKNDVPLPKTFQTFYKCVTKKMTILDTVVEDDENENLCDEN